MLKIEFRTRNCTLRHCNNARICKLKIWKQHGVEKMLLVAAGGFLGWWFSGVVGKWLGAQFPALQVTAESLPEKIVFWIALVLIVTILAGLLPSLYATGIDLNTYLKAAAAGKRRFIFSQEFLVGVQLSVALALLIGMGAWNIVFLYTC